MARKKKSFEEAAQRVLDGDEEEGENLLLDAPSGMGNTPMEVARQILAKRKAKRRAMLPEKSGISSKEYKQKIVDDLQQLNIENSKQKVQNTKPQAVIDTGPSIDPVPMPTTLQDKLDDRQEDARIQKQSDMAHQEYKEQMQNSFSSPEQVQEQSDLRAKQKQRMQMELDILTSEMLNDDLTPEERQRLQNDYKNLQKFASENFIDLDYGGIGPD